MKIERFVINTAGLADLKKLDVFKPFKTEE